MTSPAAAPRFDNAYARLPERFYHRQSAARFPAPRLLRLNRALAEELGLSPDWLASPAGVGLLSGQDLPPGAEPLAMAYAGHQFGGWNPQLGDGRALLLGEVIDRAGRRRDLHLKGSGPTPFSRGGDGKAALGPVLREYIVAEAMHALGVPTTRSLAAIGTGEAVMREGPMPGAILARVAHGHVRVGTFQYFYARQDLDALRRLADHVIARSHPEAAEAEIPALALLEAVCRAQARLIARWMSLGFIHGVMNTDNMSLSGETIDYGPCAFMEAYHPDTVYSSIDRFGRYAYVNQPGIAQWNLAQLAQCLLPLMAEDPQQALAPAQALIDAFPDLYAAERLALFRGKLGLGSARDDDEALLDALLSGMAANQVDFTLGFRALAALPSEGGPETDEPARALWVDPTAFDAWAERWRARLAAEARPEAERQAAQRAASPAFIPRNHQVEAALAAAIRGLDLAPLDRLTATLARPYEDQPEAADLALPATPEQAVTQTFCGT
ncbi:YdiU family protein [Albimonas sp. CAU 1670]|uniref:protein adenylyltransferase SelO n=1 Tax=Albimonas sp. CAU 1670 TaxID=3032599 RepID=UPI0023DC9A4F|nr:YdiU family protein [Albimonas sp. CAU 1670]MDF2232433.1 YdiU family protein [Albimonas sp. CAU 1670]